MSTSNRSKNKNLEDMSLLKNLEDMSLLKNLEDMSLLELENFAKDIGIDIDKINLNSFHIDQYISSLTILNNINAKDLKTLARELNINLSNAKVQTLRKNFIKIIYNAVIKKRM